MEKGKTDAVVMLTGGSGRIPRGIEILRKGEASHAFVSGVDPEVKPDEFARQYSLSRKMLECCVTLGFEAVDTRSNGKEVANWVKERGVKSIRLVTTDWHMARASYEVQRALPESVRVELDGVRSRPSLKILFLEYNKLIARWMLDLVED